MGAWFKNKGLLNLCEFKIYNNDSEIIELGLFKCYDEKHNNLNEFIMFESICPDDNVSLAPNVLIRILLLKGK